ncbi:hypothetical protein [Leadbetterella byssophila]|jgi:uncharacterized protein YxeA|uniref:Lipocalin-like domain-containing protein n=1 Tax=Leadbetterella byssophila (strain DSM 17132 / JCM 16389 / KACC 11308 / NBRC 106382 / 4M15) TaxID=649349 RepID=E4RQV7_LEAB4|nr:hypothetical protein [Leadbetterella byssophila]ADQ18400.1 hypothetical protein Lbys_2738 [Leadbetterella byssophila DSM 17132]
MKKLLFILFVACTACDSGEPVKHDDLTGTWEWVKTTGGFAGVNETPQDGEEVLLKIHANLTYERFRNDSLVKKGTYALSTGKSMLLQKDVKFVTFDNGVETFYEVKGQELNLTEDVYDGFNYAYKRK